MFNLKFKSAAAACTVFNTVGQIDFGVSQAGDNAEGVNYTGETCAESDGNLLYMWALEVEGHEDPFAVIYDADRHEMALSIDTPNDFQVLKSVPKLIGYFVGLAEHATGKNLSVVFDDDKVPNGMGLSLSSDPEGCDMLPEDFNPDTFSPEIH